MSDRGPSELSDVAVLGALGVLLVSVALAFLVRPAVAVLFAGAAALVAAGAKAIRS